MRWFIDEDLGPYIVEAIADVYDDNLGVERSEFTQIDIEVLSVSWRDGRMEPITPWDRRMAEELAREYVNNHLD